MFAERTPVKKGERHYEDRWPNLNGGYALDSNTVPTFMSWREGVYGWNTGVSLFGEREYRLQCLGGMGQHIPQERNGANAVKFNNEGICVKWYLHKCKGGAGRESRRRRAETHG